MSTFWVVPRSLVSTKWGILLRVVSTLWGVVHLGTCEAPNSLPVVHIAGDNTWVDTRAIQTQVVSADAIERRRRPIDAVTTTTVNRAAVDVAGVEEVIGVTPKGKRRSLISTIGLRTPITAII